MKSSEQEIVPIIGTAMGGGFYAGRINVDGQHFAIIVAPKADGEKAEAKWIHDDIAVPGARSYYDGLANTNAMAEDGSELAAWARGLRIGGNDDWYIPSQDELEVIYRNLKPTVETNSGYARSGINLSAIPPMRPYTRELPAQTQAEAFQAGGSEAFDDSWYWSSTQHAAYSGYAWLQDFYDGTQHHSNTSYEGRARAVRRLPI
ncbi:DUF1566 domain-containing protein [Herbaspirillum sp. DW155]|uniref:Lcl domain-containing protein n=1 Tax=Herbaspirillum sp. DW155 TaxID=3095609 RepID=UPI00308847A8|nr:DUF1566 domain-containing protein [Herbaspirillum sp. DW155]